MTTKIYTLLFLLFLIILSACQSPPKVKRALYHWKVKQNLSAADTLLFSQQNIQRHYLRFFDVGWDEIQGPIPKGLLNRKSKFGKSSPKMDVFGTFIQNNEQQEVIPVVFIENEVFKNIKETRVDDLAEKIAFKINEIWGIEFNKKPMRELQLDCDWSKSTELFYFGLISELRKHYPQTLFSATIRLHQIKYAEETGVPPVDKGVLMYYNMGKIKEATESNSILNNKTGQQYIHEDSNYPLPLSLALPVYSWSVWFSGDEYKGLFYSMDTEMVKNCSFLEKSDGNYYQVNRDTVFQHQYLRYGDRIRLEQASLEDLAKAKEICRPLLNNRQENELILFSYAADNSALLLDENWDFLYSLEE